VLCKSLEDEHKLEWVDVMQDEMQLLHDNHIFELVKLHKGKRVRLVVKGFRQQKYIDFDEIFSPIVNMSSIHVVFGLTASLDLEIE
jgi:hypothetical protein